jgi:hypothetical protein
VVETNDEGYKTVKLFVLVDYDRSNMDNRHVIIPFDELINFIVVVI